MTKKQLLQALSIVEEDAEVTAIFQGKYSTRYPAFNIVFINSTPQAELLLSEVVHEEAA